jgi:DnaJ-class molecular chaperone
MAEGKIVYTEVTCAHCEGLGCIYCDKKGCVPVKSPPKKCHHCEGQGCIYCGYAGWEGLKGKYD